MPYLFGRAAEPTLASAAKCTLVGKTDQERHLAQRHVRLRKVFTRQFAARRIREVVIGRAFVFQPALHRGPQPVPTCIVNIGRPWQGFLPKKLTLHHQQGFPNLNKKAIDHSGSKDQWLASFT